MTRLSAVEAVRGLVRAIEALQTANPISAGEAKACGSEDCANAWCVARRALAAFRARAPLRDDDGDLFRLVDSQLRYCAETEPLLDIIDRALLGATDTKGDRDGT